MKPSPFPPSVEERLAEIQAGYKDMTCLGAAFRLIDKQDEKIRELTARLNQARFTAQLRGYLLMGVLLVGTCALVIKAVLWWVKR